MLDPSGAALTDGTVFFVPAAAVEELARTPIDLTLPPSAAAMSSVDEPLEDLLDAHGADYPRARIAQDGRYALTALPPGRYFVVFQPAADDGAHLPGGSACRSALDAASLVGTRLDLRVSGAPSERARYVGSSGCLNCHGRHRTMATAHRVGLQVPGVRGAYQDVSRWPDIDEGLASFERGATLYFYDCDPGRDAEAKCKVAASDPVLTEPSAEVSFALELARDPGVAGDAVGAYALTLRNVAGAGEMRYPVALTYGGAVFKQNYVTRARRPDGSLGYFVLPLQWNTAGDDARPSSDDWVFRDYRSEQWYDFASNTLKEPAPSASFDTQCAGCHLTGMRLSGDATRGFSAHAVPEPAGDFDYDGDGRREEINIGCEGCHGPGSEHVEASARGLAIVSPSLLTPEREALVCGRCHSRPLGALSGTPGAPLDAAGELPRPGIRRRELAARFTSRVDGAPEDFHPSGDSAAHHAQYSDFIRSTMYRNGSVLMTCGDCHDAHGSEHPHGLRRAPDDNTACTGCHSGPEHTSPRIHVEQVTGFEHDGTSEASLTCTRCHMVKTVASGARQPALRDVIPMTPPVQYFHGDIASHRFRVTGIDQYARQPVAGTLGCAVCHGEWLPNP